MKEIKKYNISQINEVMLGNKFEIQIYLEKWKDIFNIACYFKEFKNSKLEKKSTIRNVLFFELNKEMQELIKFIESKNTKKWSNLNLKITKEEIEINYDFFNPNTKMFYNSEGIKTWEKIIKEEINYSSVLENSFFNSITDEDLLEKSKFISDRAKNKVKIDDGKIEKYIKQLKKWNEKNCDKKYLEIDSQTSFSNNINELENLVGFLGNDLKTLYKTLDKENIKDFFGFYFLNVEEIIEEIKNMERLQNEEAEYDYTNSNEAIKCNEYNWGWIPILSDGEGAYIGVDYNPAINGKVGQIINFGSSEVQQFVYADSLESFLKFILNLAEENKIKFIRNSDLINEYKYYTDENSEYEHLIDFLSNLIIEKEE